MADALIAHVQSLAFSLDGSAIRMAGEQGARSLA